MDRRDFLKTAGGTVLVAASGTYAFNFMVDKTAGWRGQEFPSSGKRYGMLINLDKCDPDCTACLDACRKENNVEYLGDKRWDIHWIRKVEVENTSGPDKAKKNVLLLCNHCDHPPCAQVCPVQATYKRDDGIVIVDHHRCIGCRYCVVACPYNARFFNFKDSHEWPNKEHPKRSHGVAEACTLCAHRLDVGAEPACVESCKQVGCDAIIVGDLNDETSEISTLIAEGSIKRLRPDLGTDPKVHYIGL